MGLEMEMEIGMGMARWADGIRLPVLHDGDGPAVRVRTPYGVCAQPCGVYPQTEPAEGGSHCSLLTATWRT